MEKDELNFLKAIEVLAKNKDLRKNFRNVGRGMAVASSILGVCAIVMGRYGFLVGGTIASVIAYLTSGVYNYIYLFFHKAPKIIQCSYYLIIYFNS